MWGGVTRWSRGREAPWRGWGHSRGAPGRAGSARPSRSGGCSEPGGAAGGRWGPGEGAWAPPDPPILGRRSEVLGVFSMRFGARLGSHPRGVPKGLGGMSPGDWGGCPQLRVPPPLLTRRTHTTAPLSLSTSGMMSTARRQRAQPRGGAGGVAPTPQIGCPPPSSPSLHTPCVCSPPGAHPPTPCCPLLSSPPIHPSLLPPIHLSPTHLPTHPPSYPPTPTHKSTHPPT